jgi:hypothetical protein
MNFPHNHIYIHDSILSVQVSYIVAQNEPYKYPNASMPLPWHNQKSPVDISWRPCLTLLHSRSSHSSEYHDRNIDKEDDTSNDTIGNFTTSRVVRKLQTEPSVNTTTDD